MFARRSFRVSEETKKTTAKRTSGGGGGGGMAQQPAATRLGLVRCEHCARQFNPHSAARHIPWCAKQQSENRKHRLSQDKRLALERYKWRISYKPTNHFVPGSGAGALDQLTSTKKGSINSSGTHSSPSASSTNSLGAASSSTTTSNNRRQTSVQQFQEQAAQERARNHWLKRSISSVTLTKQSGSLEAGGGDASSARGSPAAGNNPTARTKSTNDVRRCSQGQNIGEIVENLAARLEEIYAQNQMLVARLIDRDQRERLAGDLGDTQRGDDDAKEPAGSSCHHCKSARLALANYCHRCGCKLAAPQSSRAPVDGAESPG